MLLAETFLFNSYSITLLEKSAVRYMYIRKERMKQKTRKKDEKIIEAVKNCDTFDI
jgi:hypothetical protein